MTLIATTLCRNTPFFTADILMSSKSGRMLGRLPTNHFDVSEDMLSNFAYKPDSLTQKIYIIEKNVCVLFAGFEVEIRTFLKELEVRCRYFGENNITTQNIAEFLEQYDLKKNYGNSAFLICVAQQVTETTANYYFFKQGQWISKKSDVFGVAQACGSGANQYLSLLDLGWKAQDDSQFEPAQEAFYRNVSYIANLLAHERETMFNYEKNWGAGFETAQYVNGGFEKVDNVVYVTWQGKFTEKGELKYLQPNLFLHGRYENDILILTVVDIENGDIFENSDVTTFRSKGFSCYMYVVPKINETRIINKADIEERDYSFSSNNVAQGLSIRMPKKEQGFISQAMYTDDSSVTVEFKFRHSIELRITSARLKSIQEEAKKSFEYNNSSKH